MGEEGAGRVREMAAWKRFDPPSLAFKMGSAHKPRNAGGLWKLEKAKIRASPWSLQKEYTPADPLILAQGDLFWTSDSQNHKVLSHQVWDNLLQQP